MNRPPVWVESNMEKHKLKLVRWYDDGFPPIDLKEKEEGWISVIDGLPKNNENVLCFNVYGRMMENSYSEHSDQDSEWFKRVFTHWKPLPAKPDTTQKKEQP